MKMIGVKCSICHQTVLDNGTHCPSCGHPYSPEIVEMGIEHRQAVHELLKNDVPDDEAIGILAKSSIQSTPTLNPKGSGLFARISYWLKEFRVSS